MLRKLTSAMKDALDADDAAPLRAFQSKYEERQTLIDGFLVNGVSKVAQELLVRTRARVAELTRAGAPQKWIVFETQVAAIAEGALHSDDVSRKVAVAKRQRDEAEFGADALDDESALLWACLDLCYVPGKDHDVGLGEITEAGYGEDSADLAKEGFLDGTELYPAGTEPFTYPHHEANVRWAVGTELEEAAARVEESLGDESVDETARAALATYHATLLAARRDDHAVIEWVDFE